MWNLHTKWLYFQGQPLADSFLAVPGPPLWGWGLIACPPGRGLLKIASGSSTGRAFLCSVWLKSRPSTFFLLTALKTEQGVETLAQKHIPQLKPCCLGCFQRGPPRPPLRSLLSLSHAGGAFLGGRNGELLGSVIALHLTAAGNSSGRRRR